MATGKKSLGKVLGAVLAVGLLSATLMAESGAASRYDNQIQATVTQKLASKSQFSNVKASVEDGIVTLTGTVDLYQANSTLRSWRARRRTRRACATW